MSRMFKMLGMQSVLKKFTPQEEEETRSTFVSYINKLQPSYSLDEGLSGSKIIHFQFVIYLEHTYYTFTMYVL